MDEENNHDSPMRFKAAQRALLKAGSEWEPFFQHYALEWKRSSLKIVTAALLLDEFYRDQIEAILLEWPWQYTLPPAVLVLPWALVCCVGFFCCYASLLTPKNFRYKATLDLFGLREKRLCMTTIR